MTKDGRDVPPEPGVLEKVADFAVLVVLAVMLFPARALAYASTGSTKLPSASGCIALVGGCIAYGLVGLLTALVVYFAGGGK